MKKTPGSPPFYPEDDDNTFDRRGAQTFARPSRPGINEGEPGRPSMSSGIETPGFFPGEETDLTGPRRGRQKGDPIPGAPEGAGGMDGGQPDNFGAQLGDEQVQAIRGRRGAGGIGDGFPELQASMNEPGGAKPNPEAGGFDQRPEMAVLRRQAPQIAANLEARRARRRQAQRDYGAVPSGSDPNAPKPRPRLGRYNYNAYEGRYSK